MNMAAAAGREPLFCARVRMASTERCAYELQLQLQLHSSTSLAGSAPPKDTPLQEPRCKRACRKDRGPLHSVKGRGVKAESSVCFSLHGGVIRKWFRDWCEAGAEPKSKALGGRVAWAPQPVNTASRVMTIDRGGGEMHSQTGHSNLRSDLI